MDIVPDLPDEDNDVSRLDIGLRHYLIRKVIRVVVPRPDINAGYDARMIEFVAYVKYLEKKSFERAQTRDDYYALLARIIFRMQKQLATRPKGPADDPYGDIPLPHELADFMGLSQEELEEFDEEQNPQGPNANDEADSKETITGRVRQSVIDRLGTMLFPPPDPFAYFDGRMDTITEKLEEIEEEAYKQCEDRDDYFNIASLRAYRLQKEYKRSGESYVDRLVRYPVIFFQTETVDNGGDLLPDL